MQASSKNLAKALFKSLESGEKVDDLAKNLESYLKKNHLEGLRSKILENLSVELANYEKRNSADIRVSHEIKKDTLKKIESLLGKDEKDKTRVTVSEDLIGGFRATYKGKIFDGSVKNYLKELREVLMQ